MAVIGAAPARGPCYNKAVLDASQSAPAPPQGREAAILTAVLESYFASGTPVSSRFLSERDEASPSPATIRHVFADLETAGFLHQPHTSAGRVPTAQAIRWWLKQLPQPEALPLDCAQRLEQLLREAQDETRLWLQVSEFLADVTQQVGIVLVQPWLDSGLKYLRFFRLSDRRVLTIVVSRDGQLCERVSRVPEAYSQPELDHAARYFNECFAGWTMQAIRRELMRRVEEERAAYDELLKRVLVLSQCGVLRAGDSGALYFHGADRLVEALDSQKLGEMLVHLNQKERWLHLFTEEEENDELLHWNTGSSDLGQLGPVRIRVGLEAQQMPDFSLISTRYGQGAIGILGLTRMEYRRAVGAIALVREIFGRVRGDYPV